MFSYTSLQVPEDYKCSQCLKKGCKLWRQYPGFFVSEVDLLCVDCSLKDQKVFHDIKEDGSSTTELGSSYEIEWLVPAIPTEDYRSFWGYTSIPENGFNWWKRLPLRI